MIANLVVGLMGGIIGAIAVSVFIFFRRQESIRLGFAKAQEFCTMTRKGRRVIGRDYREGEGLKLTVVPLNAPEGITIERSILYIPWTHPNFSQFEKAEIGSKLTFFPVHPIHTSIREWENYVGLTILEN